MNAFYESARQKLSFRQNSYKAAFAEGSPAHLTLTDLADYARAFNADTDGLSHDNIMVMYGRRQMFFRIINHLKLSPMELEGIYRSALTRIAMRANRGAEE